MGTRIGFSSVGALIGVRRAGVGFAVGISSWCANRRLGADPPPGASPEGGAPPPPPPLPP